MVTLSPAKVPPTSIKTALANLNSWLGNSQEAIEQFKNVFNTQPANDALRRKYINYLQAVQELPAAARQLDILNGRKKINRQQVLQLAKYQLLSHQYKQALSLLNNYKPRNDSETFEFMSLQAQLYWLTGKPQKALQYLQDSFPPAIINDWEDDTETIRKKEQQQDFRYYTTARIYAMMKDKDNAFRALQQALDSGFHYQYVLKADTAWASFRHTDVWKNLLSAYAFENSYLQQPLPEPEDFKKAGELQFIDHNNYRIPKRKNTTIQE